ncbi:MAG: hypothetical protein CVV47_07000 [Spirochaetae bacterium HGW-Spirochaetae-3]|jgi:hypothetical protein|nr:MAG: hypothetical protein CVV47_07000 [Spirochaetae bacterium HGW-Spirochaetae-3]
MAKADKEPKGSEKATKKQTPTDSQTVNFTEKKGAKLSSELDLPATEGLQLKISYGVAAINPYDLIGNVYSISANGKVQRLGIPALIVDNAKLVSQSIVNAQRCRRYIKKETIISAGFGSFVSGSFSDSSIAESTVTQIANYADKYGDVINWERLVSYKDIFITGTYVIITSFSDLEIAFTECTSYNPKLDIMIGLVKAGGSLYSIEENTARYRVAIANYSILDKAYIEAIAKDYLKLSKPTQTQKGKQIAQSPADVISYRNEELWKTLTTKGKKVQASTIKIPSELLRIEDL